MRAGLPWGTGRADHGQPAGLPGARIRLPWGADRAPHGGGPGSSGVRTRMATLEWKGHPGDPSGLPMDQERAALGWGPGSSGVMTGLLGDKERAALGRPAMARAGIAVPRRADPRWSALRETLVWDRDPARLGWGPGSSGVGTRLVRGRETRAIAWPWLAGRVSPGSLESQRHALVGEPVRTGDEGAGSPGPRRPVRRRWGVGPPGERSLRIDRSGLAVRCHQPRGWATP